MPAGGSSAAPLQPPVYPSLLASSGRFLQRHFLLVFWVCAWLVVLVSSWLQPWNETAYMFSGLGSWILMLMVPLAIVLALLGIPAVLLLGRRRTALLLLLMVASNVVTFVWIRPDADCHFAGRDPDIWSSSGPPPLSSWSWSGLLDVLTSPAALLLFIACALVLVLVLVLCAVTDGGWRFLAGRWANLTFQVLLVMQLGILARGAFFLLEGSGAARYAAHFAPVIAALEDFIEAEGVGPDSLQELVPSYLDSMPWRVRRGPGSDPTALKYSRIGSDQFWLSIRMNNGWLSRSFFEYRSRRGTWEIRDHAPIRHY